ncbi:hypothetical protein [Streptomyces sp. NPDC004250]|uniref:hypothetical protein n=1 Tax=Streptomyces sp. NPDC004250 TaxID=3364692 RepID=UPI003693BEBA
MTKLKCPTCTRHRGPGHYLCQSCWGRLAPATRRRLSLRDDRAFARLRELHAALEARTPLPDIEVSR